MAIKFWLGITANGDVNVPGNWTDYAPIDNATHYLAGISCASCATQFNDCNCFGQAANQSALPVSADNELWGNFFLQYENYKYSYLPMWTGSGFPPGATSIPKYGDSIIFTVFQNINGITLNIPQIPSDIYYQPSVIAPIFSPRGQLNGICGPAGATALQWIEMMDVLANCPVPIGVTGNPFTLRAENVYWESSKLRHCVRVFNSGASACANNFKGKTFEQGPSYVRFLSGAGATKPDANVDITSYKGEHHFYGQISGIQSSSTSLFGRINPPTPAASQIDFNYSKGINYIYLHGVTFSGNNPRTRNQNVLYFGVGSSAGIIDRTFSRDVYYVDKNTKIPHGIKLQGSGTKLFIEHGFSGGSGTILLKRDSTPVEPYVVYDVLIGKTLMFNEYGPQIIFKGSEETNPSRMKLAEIKLSNVHNQDASIPQTQWRPSVSISNSFVDVDYLELSGGKLEMTPAFNTTETNLSTIKEGYMDAENGVFLGPDYFRIINPSAVIGVTSGFRIMNVSEEHPPQIYLREFKLYAN